VVSGGMGVNGLNKQATKAAKKTKNKNKMLANEQTCD